MAYAKKQQAKTSRETSAMQTWNKITGTMRIYGNTFEGKKKGTTITKWTCTISGKDPEGEWVNYYLPIKFAGDDAKVPETDELHTIDIANAFLSLDTYVNRSDELVKLPVLIITDCEVVE